jgi:simple sugar transport system substrate-binding protein
MTDPDATTDPRGARAAATALTRRTALAGGAAGLAAVLLEACGSASAGGTSTATRTATAPTSPVTSVFGVTGGYHFAFINHATADTFFTPTVNGIEDACRLLNCSFSWTGSNSSNVGAMATAIRTAAASGQVDGIATTLISPLLADPVDAAVGAGIPVISYNADVPGTDRMAYIGQDLELSGREMGRKIKELIPGGGRIAVFIAVPGSANLEPRLDGIKQELKGSNIRLIAPASGSGEQQDVATINAFIKRHHRSYQGYFAVDAGSTEGVALALKQYKLKGKVVGGGFDLTPDSETLLAEGTIQFAIDQQPYLQGFLATVELFMYKATEGLTGIADVDTGLKFLYPHTIRPYATTRSRYEGTSTSVGLQKA